MSQSMVDEGISNNNRISSIQQKDEVNVVQQNRKLVNRAKSKSLIRNEKTLETHPDEQNALKMN
jgi:hypothetical protein